MMFGLTDAIISKETSQVAARLLEAMFETCLEKLEDLMTIFPDISFIEKQGQLVEPPMQLRNPRMLSMASNVTDYQN